MQNTAVFLSNHRPYSRRVQREIAAGDPPWVSLGMVSGYSLATQVESLTMRASFCRVNSASSENGAETVLPAAKGPASAALRAPGGPCYNRPDRQTQGYY